MNLSELTNELAERGIWWQVGGFAVAGCVSVAILQIWDGSSCWAYRSFEIAVKDLYWMFVLPLAGLFEGVRKLFEKASEIRAAQREKMLRRSREKGLKQGIEIGHQRGHREGLREGQQEAQQIRSRLRDVPRDPETGAVTINRETLADLLGEPADSDA